MPAPRRRLQLRVLLDVARLLPAGGGGVPAALPRAARAAIALPGRNGRVPDGRAPRRCHGHAGGLAVVEIRIVVASRSRAPRHPMPVSESGWGIRRWGLEPGAPSGPRGTPAPRPGRLPAAREHRPRPTAGTAAAGSLPSIAASSASPCAVGPAGTGRPGRSGGCAPIVAAPAAEPHGGGAVQSLGGRARPGRRTDRRRGQRPPGSSPPRARSAPRRRPSRAPPRAAPNPRRSGSRRTSRTGSTRPGGRGPAARRGSPRSTGGGGRGLAPGDRGPRRGRRTGRRPADRQCARSRRDDTRCGRGSTPAATRRMLPPDPAARDAACRRTCRNVAQSRFGSGCHRPRLMTRGP